MLRGRSPIVDNQFVAGAKDVVRAHRHAQRRLVDGIIPGRAVTKKCGAEALQLGFIDHSLGVEVAHGREIAQRILLLLRAFFRRACRSRLSAAYAWLRARLGLPSGSARQRGRLGRWLLPERLSKWLV